jgi:murein DD-endopeptidase MepM/ murein hydrolase activator NlpD
MKWPLLILSWVLISSSAHGEVPPAAIEGRWEGVLKFQSTELRLAVNITRAVDGILLASLTDERNVTIPVDSIKQTGRVLRLEFRPIDGVLEGPVSEDNTRIQGTWWQGDVASPLELTRVSVPEPAPQPAPPAPSAAAPAAALTPPPLEMRVPFAPTPVTGGGKRHLAYELHITNLGGAPIQLSKLEVLTGTTPLASFEGAELNGMLQRPGAASVLDRRAVGAGLRAVAYLWLTFDATQPVPTTLRHRLTAVSRRPIEGVTVQVNDVNPVVVGAPLRGADWVASGGPGSTFGHRQALIAVDGRACVAQRYAIDWIQLKPDAKTLSAEGKENTDFRAYGAEILAVADGVVAAIHDGIPENAPGFTSRAVPITLDTIGGNYIILDLGRGLYGFYAHLQPGSQRVKVGDRVRRGQVLGLVGNSGNSTQPHLHFHVTNGNSALGAEGVPYVIDSFEVQSVPGGAWETRRKEIPLNNSRVRFSR